MEQWYVDRFSCARLRSREDSYFKTTPVDRPAAVMTAHMVEPINRSTGENIRPTRDHQGRQPSPWPIRKTELPTPRVADAHLSEGRPAAGCGLPSEESLFDPGA